VTETERTPAIGPQAAYTMQPQHYGSDAPDDRMSGWISFAGIMMILLGAFQVIEGLVALFRPDYYLVGSRGLVVSLSYTGWGWFHLILGVVVLAAGFGVMAGATWARVVGVVLALLSAIANLAFIAAYPLWSIIVILVDCAVIWALTSGYSRVRAL
jgi:vacuolar-type H+-ATPase subunit I/STV1